MFPPPLVIDKPTRIHGKVRDAFVTNAFDLEKGGALGDAGGTIIRWNTNADFRAPIGDFDASLVDRKQLLTSSIAHFGDGRVSRSWIRVSPEERSFPFVCLFVFCCFFLFKEIMYDIELLWWVEGDAIDVGDSCKFRYEIIKISFLVGSTLQPSIIINFVYSLRSSITTSIGIFKD